MCNFAHFMCANYQTMMKKLFFAFAVCCGLLMACKPVNEPTQETNLPAASRDFDAVVLWFGVGVKQSHPFIRKAWNTDADPAEFNLLLVNEDQSRISPIPNVTITKTATLTALNGEEKVNVKKTPVFVLIGNDTYGNTYVLCDFNYNL